MLKKAFNYASLGALICGWAGMGLWAWDILATFAADDALAHARAPAQRAALERINNVPVRPVLDSYSLAHLHVAPLAPPCPPSPAALSDRALCAWLTFDERRMRDTGNRYGPLSPRMQDHFAHMKNYTPDAAFQAWDEERFNRALSAIVNNPFISANYLRVTQQRDYKNTAQAIEQATLKQNLLQETADVIRAAYGLRPVPVALVRMSNGVGGSYLPVAPSIMINYDIQTGLTDSFAAMLETLSHEVRHSIDADFAALLASGEMERTDVRAGHAAAILLNFKEYIAHNDASHVPSGHFFRDSYRLQYIERHAYEYGKSFAARLIDALYCDRPARTHLCMLYKAQQRLSL